MAACVTTAIVYHAGAAKGIKLNSVESRLEGDIDLRGFLGLSEDVPRGYKEIRMYFKIDIEKNGWIPEKIMDGTGPIFEP